MHKDFISSYLEYTAGGETPAIFHRWSCLAGLGAYLGRDTYIDHGHFKVYPNNYIMLMGNPGTRKSTAIKIMKNVLVEAGYNCISADKTSKEKYLMDLAEHANDMDNSFNLAFDEALDEGAVKSFIMADEFNDFFATDAEGFLGLLCNLWDIPGVYISKTKGGEDLRIPSPTVSILGGNTPTSFAKAFPPEALGQGFLSRTILIHGEPNGRKIAFPKASDPALLAELVKDLQDIKFACTGAVDILPEARAALEDIYNTHVPLTDTRFDSYTNRRFTHLLKLCVVVAAARKSTQVSLHDVIYANTVLSAAEQVMPKALGQYGKAKNSDITHKLMEIFNNNTDNPLSTIELWSFVNNDLSKLRDLQELLSNLLLAKKIVPAGDGYITCDAALKHISGANAKYVDMSLLTEEERR